MVGIVQSWPTPVKQVTGRRKKICASFSLPMLATAAPKQVSASFQASHSHPNGLARPLPAWFLPQAARMSGQRWHRLGLGKKAVGLQPAVANLAQCQFFKQQHQRGWCWRPALPQLHLSHLDEDADPHASPKMHVTISNHHWSFKAEAVLPALALLPCASCLICLFLSSLSPSPAIIPKINCT